MSEVRQKQQVRRPAARVLLIRPDERILLFRAKFLDREFWITPGGGLNDGETHEQGALRELWEETGLSVESGLRCVWSRSHVFEWRGVTYDQQERFFLLRLHADAEIHFDNWEEAERRDLIEHRWWSTDEIEASNEIFAPRRLGELLRPLLEGVYPDEPLETGT